MHPAKDPCRLCGTGALKTCIDEEGFLDAFVCTTCGAEWLFDEGFVLSTQWAIRKIHALEAPDTDSNAKDT